MWPSSTTSLPVVLYPAPESALVSVMSVLSFASLVYLAVSELRGEHLAYSKFWHVVVAAGQQQRKRAAAAGGGGGGDTLLSSRHGMLVAYVPALVAAVASFAVPGAVEGLRARLLAAALAFHFLKRVLEVLFIHRYSGSMPLNTALTISANYLLNTVIMIYAVYLARGLPEPTVNLLYPGVLVFAIGIAGNLYHHYILSRLRKGGNVKKGYKIPRGGLFELVICPHYLFEITIFFGFAMISQTVFALVVASGTMMYLASRSYVTKSWYTSKFEEFPVRIKALVPYVF